MSASISIRDVLYEEPGPRMRRVVRVASTASVLLLVALLVFVVHRFWSAGQLSSRYWSFLARWATWRFLLMGMLGTLRVALVAGVLAMALGLVLMLGRVSQSRPLSLVCRVVTDLFRSLPSLLLIYFFFLVIPKYGLRMPSFWMITIPVALAASGVLAEVFRAGMNAVPEGQAEAALALGMTHGRVMRKIVLPQALRIVIPSLISQLVVVVKDTTVAYVVSYPDLMQNAKVLISKYDALVSMYFVVAIIYILINCATNRFSVRLAERMGTQVISRATDNPI